MRYYIVFIIFFIPLLYPKMVLGQGEKLSPVQFHGSNTLFGQYSNMQGIGQEIPSSFFRNDLQMTLSVYDIPVSASFFITSEQRDYRQSINNFKINFDPQAMARNLAKTYAINKAKGLANEKLPWMMRFMSNFRTLEIGKCRPNYSKLTLKGIAVSGVNIEFTPGKLYMAFSSGKTLRSIKPTDSLSKPVYEQKILFGKLGFGKKQETHFYLTYMHVEDVASSLPVRPEQDTTYYKKPKSNYVIGSELKLAFFEKKFTIEGEGAVSMLTRDTQSLTIDMEDSDVPSWAIDHFNPNISSSVDYAYNIKTALKLKTTKITGGLSMVGPGFTTLGNPNLRNDRLTYQGRIDQTFAKKQLSLSVFYRQHSDNLINWKTAKSTVVAYGINVGFRFKKVPYLQVGYMPNFMNTDNDSLKLENSVYLITAASGYNYKIGDLRTNTSFNFFYQNSETIMDTVKNTTKNQTYTLNQQLTFKVPLSIAAGVSYSKSEFLAEKRDILMLTANATHSAFKGKWQNSLGVKYSNQNYEQYKLGFFLNSRAQLGKMFDFEIRIEDNIYRENCIVANNFNEFIATSTLTMKW